MLKDIFFMVKMIGLTVLVALLLQFKVNEQTLDAHLQGWVANSVFVDFIQTSIEGGVAITKVGYKKIHSGVSTTLAKFSKKHKKDERGINLHIKRYNEDDEDSDQKIGATVPQRR